jgi:hypothetical protein
MEQVSFMSACRAFFGQLPGQTAMQFGHELMALTNDDRQEIAAGLAKNGFNIDPASVERKQRSTGKEMGR